jgi:hypothetical protein
VGRTLVGAVAVVGLLTWSAPVSAKRTKPTQVVAPKRAKAKADADPSKGGTQRGGLELALGSITAVLTGVLIGRGAWELVNANRIEEECRNDASSDPNCTGVLGARPWRMARVAGGLSLGFAVPMAIASGFLFRRGVRVHRAWKAWHAQDRAVAVTPWAGRNGGGLSFALRF